VDTIPILKLQGSSLLQQDTLVPPLEVNGTIDPPGLKVPVTTPRHLSICWTLMQYEQYKQVAQRHQARACYVRGPFIIFGKKCEFARKIQKTK